MLGGGRRGAESQNQGSSVSRRRDFPQATACCARRRGRGTLNLVRAASRLASALSACSAASECFALPGSSCHARSACLRSAAVTMSAPSRSTPDGGRPHASVCSGRAAAAMVLIPPGGRGIPLHGVYRQAEPSRRERVLAVAGLRGAAGHDPSCRRRPSCAPAGNVCGRTAALCKARLWRSRLGRGCGVARLRAGVARRAVAPQSTAGGVGGLRTVAVLGSLGGKLQEHHGGR